MGGERYSKEELLELLKKHSDLTAGEWRGRDDLPSLSPIQRHFGSWNRAREEAGLEVRVKRYSKDELLELLEKNPDILQKGWQKRDDLPSYTTILTHFGSWREAKEAIGREPEVVSSYSKEELLNLIKKNPDLKPSEWNEREDLPHSDTIRNHFGSWDDAREEAGIQPETQTQENYIEEELIELIQENPEISRDEWNERDGLPSINPVIKYFNSWNNFKREAEINHEKQSQKKYTKKELIKLIQENPDLKMNEWSKRDDLPSITPIITRFGSWNKFREEAGLKPRQKIRSKEKLLELLKENLDITQEEWIERDDLPSVKQIYRVFGSWSKAKEEAKHNHRETTLSDYS